VQTGLNSLSITAFGNLIQCHKITALRNGITLKAPHDRSALVNTVSNADRVSLL